MVHMKIRMSDRMLMISGLLYILIGVLPLGLLPPPPVYGAPATELISYYQQYGTRFQIVTYLGILGIGLFYLFLGYLYGALRQTGQNRSHLQTVALLAGLGWGLIYLIFSGLIQSLPGLARTDADPRLLTFLADLTDMGFTTNTVLAAVLVGSASLLLSRGKSLVRWLGLFGIVLVTPVQILASLCLMIHNGLFLPAGPIYNGAFILFELWLLLVSLLLKPPSREP